MNSEATWDSSAAFDGYPASTGPTSTRLARREDPTGSSAEPVAGLTGTADVQIGDAVRLLREAGHAEEAHTVEREILGRDVIPGHWTFQIVEAYDRTYHRPFTDLEHRLVQDLAQG